MLVNLLENAAKHGGKRINIRATADADQVRLDIEDDGSGIAPDLRHMSSTVSAEGTERPRRKSAWAFRYARDWWRPWTASLRRKVRLVAGVALGFPSTCLPVPSLATTMCLNMNTDSRKHRVLIVDDEAAILRFLRTNLSANGYDLIEATTGAEAIRLATSGLPMSFSSTSVCRTWTARRS